jgi:hypothetical protein
MSKPQLPEPDGTKDHPVNREIIAEYTEFKNKYGTIHDPRDGDRWIGCDDPLDVEEWR